MASPLGISTQLTLIDYFSMLLEVNELHARSTSPMERRKILTDAQILKRLLQEFPQSAYVKGMLEYNRELSAGRPRPKGKPTINAFRQKYNRGELFSPIIPPEIFSFRYSSDGYPVNRRGKTYLTALEIQATLLEHGRKRRKALSLLKKRKREKEYRKTYIRKPKNSADAKRIKQV